MNQRSKFRGYRYQQLGHEALLQNSMLYELTPEERDLYFILRLKAGESRQLNDNNDGGLYHRGQKMKAADAARFIAGEFRYKVPCAERALISLKEHGFLSATKAGYLSISRWKDEQLAAPSDTAAQKRASRLKEDIEQSRNVLTAHNGTSIADGDLEKLLCAGLKKRGASRLVEALVDAGTIVLMKNGKYLVRAPIAGNEYRGAARPRPLSRDDESRADMSTTSPPDSRERSKKEADNINRVRVESPPNGSYSEPPGPRTARGAGARKTRASIDPRDVDVYAEDPIRATMLLTGESGQKSERGFRKKLNRLEDSCGHETGLQVYRECLKEMQADLMEDRPVKNSGAVLHSKLGDRIAEINPQNVEAS